MHNQKNCVFKNVTIGIGSKILDDKKNLIDDMKKFVFLNLIYHLNKGMFSQCRLSESNLIKEN